jgi:hypothetical protein
LSGWSKLRLRPTKSASQHCGAFNTIEYMKDKKIKIKADRENKEAKSPHHIVSYIDNLKADIAAFFDLNSEHSFRPFDVHDHFGVQDKKVRHLINEIVHELEEAGRLTYHQNGTYQAGPNKPVNKGLTGRVDGLTNPLPLSSLKAEMMIYM